MASQRTEFGGELAARLTGLNALGVAFVFGLSAFRSFSGGSDTARDLVIWPLPFAAFFAVISATFLVPGLARWLIRARYFYHWRMIFAVAKLVIAALIWCGLMVSVLMIPPHPELIFLVFMHVTTSTLYYIALFVFPGGYADRLGARAPTPMEYAPRDAAPKRAPGSHWIHVLIAAPLFIVAAAGLYGDRWASFVPTLDLSNFAYQSSLIFLMYCLILGVVAAHFGKLHRTGFWLFGSRAVNLMLAPAVFLALGVMTFTPAVTKGLPDLHARALPGPEATTTVRIAALIDPERRSGCEWGVDVISEVYFSTRPHEVCGIERRLWRRLAPGDDVRLEGYRTPFGFRYATVTAAE